MKKIILIDDDYLVVQALETIINSHAHLQVVAVGHDGSQAVALYEAHQPDMLLLDIRMEQQSGLAAAKDVLAQFPTANILFVTTFPDDAYISQALAIGCRGYILKQNIKGILPAIEAALNGQFVFDNTIVAAIQPHASAKQFSHLSDRENTLLHLVAEGLSNKEIALAMHLSEGTVRNYLSLLLEKLNLRDRTQLAVYYYKH
ncbi:MAG: response regulator transcription factor [Aerococcaceae bacterium]|nr:response regulator transcription factor [Aerococcaceae bacterium]